MDPSGSPPPIDIPRTGISPTPGAVTSSKTFAQMNVSVPSTGASALPVTTDSLTEPEGNTGGEHAPPAKPLSFDEVAPMTVRPQMQQAIDTEKASCLVVSDVRSGVQPRQQWLLHALDEKNWDGIETFIGECSFEEVNIIDDSHYTPLHRLVIENKPSLVKKLLERFPGLMSSPSPENRTPLHLALSSDQNTKRMVKILLEQDASVSEKDSDGQTPLELAKANRFLQKSLKKLVKKSNFDALFKYEKLWCTDEAFIQKSLGILSSQEEMSRDLKHLKIVARHISYQKTLTTLLKLGLNPECRDGKWLTLPCYLLKYNKPGMIEYLIEQKEANTSSRSQGK